MRKYIKSALIDSGEVLATGLEDAFKGIPNYVRILRSIKHEPTQKKLRELYAVRAKAGPFMSEMWNSEINILIDEFEKALNLSSH